MQIKTSFKYLVIVALLHCASINVIASPNENVEVVKVGNRTLIQSSSCRKIEETFQSLTKALTKQLIESNKMPSCSCHLDKCFMDVTEDLPEYFTRIAGVNPGDGARFGPNCWNTVLYTKKIVKGVRASTSEEISFWTKSPLCRILKKEESLIPGDIGLIRTNKKSLPEIHGFIFLSENLVFEKKNALYGSTAQFERLSNNIEYNGWISGDIGSTLRDRCSRLGNSPSLLQNKRCKGWVNYFRCEDFDSFVQKIQSRKNI